MNKKIIRETFSFPDGRTVEVETGRLANQADGAVVVRMGDMMLLATVVVSKEIKPDCSFLPLYVDYQEKFASAGKIPGGFLRREGKLNDSEVLISRLVDRAIRPLFPDNFANETQVFIQMMSSDENIPSDAFCAFATSCAIMISDVPLQCAVSEVRVVREKETFHINPSKKIIEKADLNLIVGGTEKNITMVEGELQEVEESVVVEAIKFAHEEIKRQCIFQNTWAEKVGVKEKLPPLELQEIEELEKKVETEIYPQLYQIAEKKYPSKKERSQAIDEVKNKFLETLEEKEIEIGVRYFKKAKYTALRNFVLDKKQRIDGRTYEEIRHIDCEIDYLPATHGSSLFTRGETQSLTSVTLGTRLDEQLIDHAVLRSTNRFILHYNFPAFSTGEVKPNRGPGRREIGHGNLAHRALVPVIPKNITDLFTIRLVSDILEANGSSSMATVCAGSLALMDAGVKIKSPVSGVAMGMISDVKNNRYAILSDILGEEDHLGDMDFKVTGTKKGITACQMDIKIEGLSFELLAEALEQARKGRLTILEKMNETIPHSREEHKANAPKAELVHVPKSMVGSIIGPGGRHIQELQQKTSTHVSIETPETEQKALVTIFGHSTEGVQEAKKIILSMIAIPEEGKIYLGIVKSIVQFGIFIEFLKGKEGLLHPSEMFSDVSRDFEKRFRTGEKVKVILTQVDRKTGKYRLSQKQMKE